MATSWQRAPCHPSFLWHALLGRSTLLLFLLLLLSTQAQSQGVQPPPSHDSNKGGPEIVFDLDVKLIGGTGSEFNTTKFTLYRGDVVYDSIVQFVTRHGLHAHHIDELAEAVRDYSLVQGGPLIPYTTLILANTDDNPFAPHNNHRHQQQQRPLVISLKDNSHEAVETFTEGVDHYASSLLDALAYIRGTNGEMGIYAVISPGTQFLPGVDPHRLFLEFQRLRFAHTGTFDGDFIVVLSCTRPEWNVLLFTGSVVHGLDLGQWTGSTLVGAMLSNPLTYYADTLTRQLITCYDVRLPLPASELDVLVVVVAQGRDDPTTFGVFEDIAHMLHQGFQDIGLTSAIAICTFLSKCRLPMGRGPQWVVLAPHNLASYVNDQDEPAVLSRDDLIPPDAILYNFEHIPNPASRLANHSREGPRQGSLVNQHVVDIYRKYRIWDYSSANVERLKAFNVSATYVPLGYSSSLLISRSYSGGHPPPPPQNDVLFFGTVLPRRQAIIRELRSAGIRVSYVNAANNGIYGKELDDYLMDSKIILSLLAFDDDSEWKMTRFLKPLANKRLVISEESGSLAERGMFHDSIVFVNRTGIVSACRYYLDHPQERESRALKGFQDLSSPTEVDILQGVPQVREIMHKAMRKKNKVGSEEAETETCDNHSNVPR